MTCSECPNDVEGDYSRCAACRDRRRLHKNKRYARLREVGRCTYAGCGASAISGKCMCARHRDLIAIANRDRARAKKRGVP